MDHIEVVQNEVEKGGPGGGGAIPLPSFVDLDLRDLRLFHLLLDLRRRALGGLEVLDQLVVAQEVTLGGR